MAARSRGYNEGQDWDPMRDDFDDSNYDHQYNDDATSNNSPQVELEHSRLYVRSIPPGLNAEGLRAAFAKYGTLEDVFFRQDPLKRYALVTYETPAEARHALIKLNKTEPLKLIVSMALKQKSEQNRQPRINTRYNDRSREERSGRDDRTYKEERSYRGDRSSREERSHREDRSTKEDRNYRDETEARHSQRGEGRDRDDNSVGSRNRNNRRLDDMANGDSVQDIALEFADDLNLESLDPDLQLKLENLRLQQLQVKQRILIEEAKRKNILAQKTASSRCLLPGGKVVIRNAIDGRDPHEERSFAAGAGDSNGRETVCSCNAKRTWDQQAASDGRSSTPSTCKGCQENSGPNTYQDKSETSKLTKKCDLKKHDCKVDTKTTDLASRKSITSKTTDATSKKSDYSKLTDTVCRRSGSTCKRLELVHSKYVLKNKSDMTCDLKYTDFYSDSEDEADETNRLIQLRNTDYMDIVDDNLKIVIALAGYPRSKMRLKQMEVFQRCLSEVMDMQLKNGLLKKVPSFLDYYLNKGAVVCICKDLDTRDWMVRVSPGLQERMCINMILLKSKVKRLCLAMLKIPRSCWPATAQDTFKLLQYFNPTLRTNLWRIYAQKIVDNIECTSFLVDRVSGEIIRGPNFKNVIDYQQMEFELSGYVEIYYECLLSDLEEDLSSVGSRVKLLEEIKSKNATPTNQSVENVQKSQKHDKIESKKDTYQTENIAKQPDSKEQDLKDDVNEESQPQVVIQTVNDSYVSEKTDVDAWADDVNENTLQNEVLTKPSDGNYISEKNDMLDWSNVNKYRNEEYRNEIEGNDECNRVNKIPTMTSTSGVAMSERTVSIIESNDNLINRSSNVNIDSNRGIAYHRRTNYLHVENELKIAITLDGYPVNKLEGTHIRRLKHLFKEYLHKDMKNQRFANLIIPKFQDIYLSNGAVIYVCDSLETKDYLTEVLPKFVNSTGLKLTFRDVKNLVRYTRVVMRLCKEHAHVESLEILLKLKLKYPGLKPDCWKYYSDVAGKQKRQFGVDPESLDVIKSPDFDPMYEDEKISFRIIDRQKRDVSFDEHSADLYTDAVDIEMRKIREKRVKSIYVPIDSDIMNAPLTRIRTNHYSDVIADDYKLYVGPSNYPESRIDEVLFHSIKRCIENIVLESFEKGELSKDTMPKFHDIYLFDGVIFLICQNMASRNWVETTLRLVNSKLHMQLKATEFRGAVGIISMTIKSDKDADEVIQTLQNQNPRLRSKFWRKISVIRTKSRLDVILQIDKLSAQVITSQDFNKYVGPNAVQFRLGHLQSLLKPKASLEELNKQQSRIAKTVDTKLAGEKTKSVVSIRVPRNKSFEELIVELKKEYPSLQIDDWEYICQEESAAYQICELQIDEESARMIENEHFKLAMGDDKIYFYPELPSQRSDVEHITEAESPRSADSGGMLPENNSQELRKIIVEIPANILPDNKEDIHILFDVLEDKNPGLNTELWQMFTDLPYPSNGKFTLLVDRQSAAVIQSKNFDPTVGGERLKFFY